MPLDLGYFLLYTYNMSDTVKTKRFLLALTPEQHAQLFDLARLQDISAGELIRRLVSREHEYIKQLASYGRKPEPVE